MSTQRLATLGVDAVDLRTYAGGRYAVIQRDPQPDEAARPRSTALRLRLVDLEGDPRDAPPALAAVAFDVYAAGTRVLRYAAGVATWDAAWTGTVALNDLAAPYCYQQIDALQVAPPLFASTQAVPVRVVVTPGAPALDLTYTFLCADETPPTLLAAVALDATTIRATFDEPLATTGAGSALLPAAYALTAQNVPPAPGVALTVVAVAAAPDGGGAAFDLTVQWEQTPRCPYALAVAPTVTDRAGNAIAAGAAVTFAGFAPAVPAGRSFDLWHLLVPAKRRTEDQLGELERWVACLQEVADLLLTTIDAFPAALADLDRCSDAVVDAMLADLGNPFTWPELALSAAARRKLLRNLVALYGARGTAVGITAAVRLLLGLEVAVAPYLATGWVLGRDALGTGRIARIACTAVAPYDFTAVPAPWVGTFAVDAGAGQVVTLVPGDFADPAAATAAEVAAAIAARCAGAGAHPVTDGSPATLDGGAAPYDLSLPAPLLLDVGGVRYERVLQPTWFATPASVPLAAVLARLADLGAGTWDALAGPGDALRLRTRATGPAATITVVNDPANTGAVALGLALGSTAAGAAGQRVAVYSTTVGPGARIALTDPGSALDQVCGWWPYYAAGTGAAVLAPDTARARYTFDLETAAAVDAATAALIRRIADVMRCAHEHVGRVRTAPTAPAPYWTLGSSALNVDTRLAE